MRCNSRGFSLVSLVLTVGLLALLYALLVGLNESSRAAEETLMEAPAAGRQTACLMNRMALGRSLLTWEVTHPDERPTPAKLRRSGIEVPSCPEGGIYSFESRGVLCSEHPEPAAAAH